MELVDPRGLSGEVRMMDGAGEDVRAGIARRGTGGISEGGFIMVCLRRTRVIPAKLGTLLDFKIVRGGKRRLEGLPSGP